MDHDDRPLVERLEVSTQSEAAAEEFVRASYPGCRTRFEGAAGTAPAHISITAGRSERIGTDHVRSTVNYSTVIEPRRYFCSAVPYSGRLQITTGREETICSAGEVCHYPMDVPLDLALSDLGVWTLRLPMEPLDEAAEEVAGVESAELEFTAATPVSAAAGRRWTAFVKLASSLLLAKTPTMTPVLAEELARSAAVTALHTFPNTALTVPYQRRQGWVAESAAHRAAAFVQAHADEPVTVKEIAAIAGVSTRVLRNAFHRYFDTTPTGYLRQVRLERAHAELQDADTADGVILEQVARRWGWTSASQLAVAYQQRFGELPDHTSRAQRG